MARLQLDVEEWQVLHQAATKAIEEGDARPCLRSAKQGIEQMLSVVKRGRLRLGDKRDVYVHDCAEAGCDRYAKRNDPS